jgi:hypothetical protein
LLAILGGNSQSPGCAVHVQCDTADPGRLAAPSGVLMRILQEELRKQGIDVPFKGMRDCNRDWLQQDLRWLEALFKNA